MSRQIKLYGRPSSVNVRRALWLLKELDRPVEIIPKGGKFGGLDDPEYRALNPNGLVPVIDDGGTVIWETNAILRYLAARYRVGTFWPDNAADRARADMWLDWWISTLAPPLRTLARGRRGLDGITEAQMGDAETALEACFRQLDDALGADYLAGGTITVADVGVAPGAYFWRLLVPAGPALARLDAYMARIGARPSFQATVAAPMQD